MADKNSDENENLKEDLKGDQEAVTEEDNSADDDQIATIKKQLDEAQNDYLRAQAEIQNMQKSNQREQSELAKYGAQGLAKDIVPAMDDLKRALEVKVDDESGQQLKSGIEMVYKHLKKALKDNDISEIDEAGVDFNPELHQAVQTVAASDEHPSGTVVQVLQTGYELAGRVIRPAMVVVAQ